MTRALILAAALMLGGCGTEAVWIPLVSAGLGYVASVNDLAGNIIVSKETAPPPDHPPLDGTWVPP